MHIPEGVREIILRWDGEGQPVAKLYDFFWHPQLLLSYHLILLQSLLTPHPFQGLPTPPIQ